MGIYKCVLHGTQFFQNPGVIRIKKIRGVSAKMSYPSVTDSSRERERDILRNVWQTVPKGTHDNEYSGRWANSSFRIVNNAGDVLSRKNYSCGGSKYGWISSRHVKSNLWRGVKVKAAVMELEFRLLPAT